MTITASGIDQSGVLAKNSGKLALANVAVVTTGKSSPSDSSSYGLNSGVLAFTGSTITQTGGSVTTKRDGANAVFAYGTGSSVVISGERLNATGQFAAGIMASGGGSLTATGLSVSTAGGSSAAVATDRGGGMPGLVVPRWRFPGPAVVARLSGLRRLRAKSTP